MDSVPSRDPNETAATPPPPRADVSTSRTLEYETIPGPANRETFIAAQARERRAGWAYAGLATVTVLATGLPLSVAVAPMLYIATMPVVTILSLYHPHAFI
jgi:hypothetical protein